jgi:hypothetical protein
MIVRGTACKLHSSKTLTTLLKLDITKAFDTMDWSFLIEVLRKLGFGELLLPCIHALPRCLSSLHAHSLEWFSEDANRPSAWTMARRPPLSAAVHLDHGNSPFDDYEGF